MTAKGAGAAFNEDSVKNWLLTLHSRCEGYINISYVETGTKYRMGKFFHVTEIDKAVSYVKYLDSENYQSIYVRISTLKSIPEKGKRGGQDYTKHVPAFWADIDLGSEGHKHELCPSTCKKAHSHTVNPLPPDSFAVFDIFADSDIPEPTCWQFSGGGLYPFWLLDEPFDASARDDLDRVCSLSDRIEEKIFDTLAERGFHYGRGISNIDRILRLPGTVNRKTDNWRQSDIIPFDESATYSLEDLEQFFPRKVASKLPLVPAQLALPTRLDRAVSPLDAFAQAANIADLLEPLGWEKVGGVYPEELWRRPGSSAPFSAKWNHGGTPVLVVHSTEAGLPVGAGQNLTLSRLLAHLHFNGSTESAARGLLEAAGGNPGAPSVFASMPHVLQAVRQLCDVKVYDGHKTPAAEVPDGYDADMPGEDPFKLEELSFPVEESPASNLSGSDGPVAIELDVLLSEEDEPYDWLVPGLIERGDRIMITAAPGTGKSTLVRQFGIQLSSGIHPFSLVDINPLKVLLIDAENSPRQTKRKLRSMRIAAGNHYRSSPGFHITHISGADITGKADQEALRKHIAEVSPDLLMIGPIYKMIGGEPKDEPPAREAAIWIDKIRAEVGCAVLIEAHSAKGSPGDNKPQPMTPYGASLWTRWPEFGMYITEDGVLRHWRGQRDEREWPSRLERGGIWPWTVRPDVLQACSLDFDPQEYAQKKHVKIYGENDITEQIIDFINDNNIQIGNSGNETEAELITRDYPGILFKKSEIASAVRIFRHRMCVKTEIAGFSELDS